MDERNEILMNIHNSNNNSTSDRLPIPNIPIIEDMVAYSMKDDDDDDDEE